MIRSQRLALRPSSRLLAAALLALAGSVAAHDDDGVETRLKGYREVPSVSTTAAGRFRASINEAAGTIAYELNYSGLEAPVRMAHIHLGQRGVNGGITVWLCQTVAPFIPPAGTPDSPPCPQSGTVSGVISAANVIGPAAQGIAATEFAELMAAIRAGVAYVNVHSDKYPGGEIRGQLRDD